MAQDTLAEEPPASPENPSRSPILARLRRPTQEMVIPATHHRTPADPNAPTALLRLATRRPDIAHYGRGLRRQVGHLLARPSATVVTATSVHRRVQGHARIAPMHGGAVTTATPLPANVIHKPWTGLVLFQVSRQARPP